MTYTAAPRFTRPSSRAKPPSSRACPNRSTCLSASCSHSAWTSSSSRWASASRWPAPRPISGQWPVGGGQQTGLSPPATKGLEIETAGRDAHLASRQDLIWPLATDHWPLVLDTEEHLVSFKPF